MLQTLTQAMRISFGQLGNFVQLTRFGQDYIDNLYRRVIKRRLQTSGQAARYLALTSCFVAAMSITTVFNVCARFLA